LVVDEGTADMVAVMSCNLAEISGGLTRMASISRL
jgi:hypothetical protein